VGSRRKTPLPSCLPVVEEVFKPFNIFSTVFSHIYDISYFVDEFFEHHIVLVICRVTKVQNFNFLQQVEVSTKEKLGWNLLASENFFQGMIIFCAGTLIAIL